MEKCDCGCDRNGWKTVKDYSDLVWKCEDTTSGYYFGDGRKEEEGYDPLWGRPIRFTTPPNGWKVGRIPYQYRRIILWSNNEFSEDDVCCYGNEMTKEEISKELSSMRTPHWEVFDKDGGEFPIDGVYKSEEDYYEGIHNLDNFNLLLDPEYEGDICWINIQTLINNNLLQVRCSSYYDKK
tara:strand:+ start:1242 stop:1784 length:543 start_codon:yes stop_codon:yes gene_type:complete